MMITPFKDLSSQLVNGTQVKRGMRYTHLLEDIHGDVIERDRTSITRDIYKLDHKPRRIEFGYLASFLSTILISQVTSSL